MQHIENIPAAGGVVFNPYPTGKLYLTQRIENIPYTGAGFFLDAIDPEFTDGVEEPAPAYFCGRIFSAIPPGEHGFFSVHGQVLIEDLCNDKPYDIYVRRHNTFSRSAWKRIWGRVSTNPDLNRVTLEVSTIFKAGSTHFFTLGFGHYVVGDGEPRPDVLPGRENTFLTVSRIR